MLMPLPILALAAVSLPPSNVMQLEFHDAAVQAAPLHGSAKVSVLIENPTSSTFELVGASTPMADQTMLQRYIKDSHGILQLDPVSTLKLPPKSQTVIAPGTLELQITGLNYELKPGLEVPFNLKFADGSKRTIRLTIQGE